MSDDMLDSILNDTGDATERDALRDAWHRLDALEPVEPSPELARRFARAIELSRAVPARPPSLARRLLPIAAVLVIGIAIGGLARFIPRAQDDELERLGRAVSLAFEPRTLAPRRLRAVEMLAAHAHDPAIGRILADVATGDPSVGVRLGAIAAVGPYASDDEIARRLIRAVRETDSTLIRIRLIELFVDYQINAALPDIESLTDDSRTDALVRETAQWAAARL